MRTNDWAVNCTRLGLNALLIGLVYALGATGLNAADANARTPEILGRVPVATTKHFAFFSDLDTNLNDALLNSGVALRSKTATTRLFHDGPEAVAFSRLIPAARVAWDRAVDYYAELISPEGFTGREQFALRLHLAHMEGDAVNGNTRQYLAITDNFLAAARPAYVTCRWPAQDARNRQWIEDLKTRLIPVEDRIAARLEAVYQNRWRVLPNLVDVVETVDWSGANTGWSDTGQGHLLVSAASEDYSAVEVVFHEASHVLMDRNDPVRQALDDAAKAAGWKAPGELWHVVLFYTTGQIVREVLEQDGHPYKPMLYGIYDRGSWTQYRVALEQGWQPYLDGKATLAEAATHLIAIVRATR